jgi:argininosuccinate lyase
LAYNRDNQEDKETLFDVIDTVQACLQAYAELLPTITVNKKAMLESAERGFATATDIADYLVQKGIAFRDAHAVVGKIVAHAISAECTLAEMSLSDLQQYSEHIEADIYKFIELSGSVAARDHIGGTAPAQVKQAVVQAKAYLASLP